MPKRKKQKQTKKVRKSGLTLMNLKISAADRQVFKAKAAKATNGNVSALIIRAVKIASIDKLRSFL